MSIFVGFVVLIIILATAADLADASDNRNCSKVGGTMVQEYKSSLWICAKVEKLKY